MTVTDASAALYVARVTLSKILNGSAGISADMALRLAQWLGTSPDLWLELQTQFDLWQASKQQVSARIQNDPGVRAEGLPRGNGGLTILSGRG